jgi:hypothetical protein
MQIPFINVIDDDWMFAGKKSQEPTSSNSLINLFPGHQLVDAIDDLIKYWRWNRVIIVYADQKRNTVV